MPGAESAQPPIDLQKLLTAAQDLAPAQQSKFVAAALPRLPETNQTLLWPIATAGGLAEPVLVEAAAAEIARSERPEVVAAAVDYLNHVAPDRVWRTLSTPEVSKRFEALMNRVEEFDWIRVAQVLPELKPGSSAHASPPVVRQTRCHTGPYLATHIR
jgi:hypothetical protein